MVAEQLKPDWSIFEEVITWMRAHGVQRMRVAEIDIHLGALPAKPAPPAEPLTEAELSLLWKEQQEDQEELLFASSEGIRERLEPK